MQKLKPSRITSVNMETIEALAETFISDPEHYMPWLVECCNDFELSKTLLLLVIMQSFVIQKEGKHCIVFYVLFFFSDI